jgi:pilus assembly protein FimV
MTRTALQLGTVMIAICLCVVVSTAQTAKGGAPHSSESAPMTVSGCLLQISASTGGAEQFMLANARRVSAPATDDAREPATPGSGGVSGTAGSGATPQSATGGATPSGARGAATVASGAAPERYVVTGLGPNELRKHVNHHVELRGSLEKGHPSDRGTAAASGERLGGSASGAGTSSSGATSGLGSVAGSSGSAGTPGAPNPSGASTASGTSTTGATSGSGGVAGSSASAAAPASKASSSTEKKTGDGPSPSGAIGDSPRFRAISLRMIAGACPSSSTPD